MKAIVILHIELMLVWYCYVFVNFVQVFVKVSRNLYSKIK